MTVSCADVLNIAHISFFKAERPRALEISDGDMAPSTSWGERIGKGQEDSNVMKMKT